MDYMDSNKIGQRIENKLIHALGRTISEATNDEIYKAAAESIRDDIMISKSCIIFFIRNLIKIKSHLPECFPICLI